MASKDKPSDNLQPAPFPTLTQPDQAAGLQELYTTVVEKIRQSIGWYDQRKRKHKFRGLFLRMAAVILAGLASITPIVIAMLPPPPIWDWNPVRLVPLASLLAALAAGCIGVDKLLGHSASWMRYLTTLLELEAQLEALQFAWARRALEAQSLQLPPKENLTASLNLLQESLAKVEQLLKTETLDWVTQFSGNLQELEKSIAAKRTELAALPAPVSGALRVEIPNVDTLDGHAYTLQLGEGPESTHTSSAAAFTGLPAGLLKVRFSARRNNQEISLEDVVSIRPGELTPVKVPLT